LNLSGSWQQGHSATYNTLVCKGFYPPLGGNYNSRRSKRALPNGLSQRPCLWEPKLLLRVCNRAAGACVASSPDSDLGRSVIIQRRVTQRHWLFNQAR
ncbi:unnamed protein product, partial [Brassica napus]